MLFNSTSLRLLLIGPLVVVAGPGVAQGPVITSVMPRANAHTVARTAALTISFSQPLLAGSAAGLQVFSQQRGGRRTQLVAATASGSTLSFAPVTAPYMPGETVQYTLTPAVASSGGALQRPRVGQFTTAAGGRGRGSFVSGSNPGMGFAPNNLTLGDVDNDGDLDLLTTGGVVSVRLNGGDASGSNTGRFSGLQTVPVGGLPRDVGLLDIDGDGDLDLLAVNGASSSSVSMCLNRGSANTLAPGTFGSSQLVAVGNSPNTLAVGDVDGDGDLDFATSNWIDNTVSVCLNNQAASPGQPASFGSHTVPVGRGPQRVVLADVDNDGDLDLLTVNALDFTISIRLNGGDASGSNTGVFGNGTELSTTDRHDSLQVGDVDGDGDLDLVCANTTYLANSVSVFLNGGNASGSNVGRFSRGQVLALPDNPLGLALGDVDADGDLDLLMTSQDNLTYQARVYLNGGDATGSNTGRFSFNQSVAVGGGCFNLALGDVDGDGDLDLLTCNNYDDNVSVRLNGGTTLGLVPAATAPWTLWPNPSAAATTVLITGLTSASLVQLLDALGRPVLSTKANAQGTAQLRLPAGLAPGLYLVRSGGRSQRLLVE